MWQYFDTFYDFPMECNVFSGYIRVYYMLYKCTIAALHFIKTYWCMIAIFRFIKIYRRLFGEVSHSSLGKNQFVD